jgi:hypothetical protein
MRENCLISLLSFVSGVDVIMPVVLALKEHAQYHLDTPLGGYSREAILADGLG